MINLLNKKFRRTTLITIGCIAFLVGLAYGRGSVPVGEGLLLVAFLLCAVTIPRKRLAAVLAIVLFAISIGAYRAQQFSRQLSPYERLYGRKVLITAKAATDAVYANNGQLEFDAVNVVFKEPFSSSAPGTLKVQGYGANSISRGDELAISGKLFPTGGARQAKLSFAEINVLGPNNSKFEFMRKRFVAGMFSAVPEPEASFGLGLLIGQRTTLPESLNTQLAIAGLTHIIAVSGYNLTIIVRAVRRALGKRSKYQSTLLSFLLIGLFIFVTGFSASIVRAAVVSGLSLLAWYYGRSIKPMLLLGFTAAVTAAWNPIYLWQDIGWRLSFLAFFGVLILAPLIKQRLYGDKPQKLLGQVVLESFCAQLMAAPFILYIFGQVSLIALVSNAVIVPIVPLAMLLSLFAGLGGMLFPVLGGLIAFPATIVLTYMLDLVALFARVPGALVKTSISLSSTIYVYLLVIFMILVLRKSIVRRYARITERNIIE